MKGGGVGCAVLLPTVVYSGSKECWVALLGCPRSMLATKGLLRVVGDKLRLIIIGVNIVVVVPFVRKVSRL